jgi:ABC-type branched-subunit amino acid transport system substrate-binding protein
MWSLSEFIDIAGENADNSYFVAPAPHPLVSQEAPDFLARYRSSFPDEQIGWVSVHAYEAMQVLLAAVSQSSEPTAPNIQRELSRTNYHSRMLGDIRFSEHGEWKAPSFHVYRWNGIERTLPQTN